MQEIAIEPGAASRRWRGVALVAGAAAVVGLLICGALLEAFSWRSAFAVNIGLGLIALVGTLIHVPESADPQAPRPSSTPGWRRWSP